MQRHYLRLQSQELCLGHMTDEIAVVALALDVLNTQSEDVTLAARQGKRRGMLGFDFRHALQSSARERRAVGDDGRETSR
jgi:hypothetical protein